MAHFPRRAPICYLLAATIAVASCNARAAPSGPSVQVPARVQRVVVLGDSLATYPSRDESFPAVLQRRVTESGLQWTVTNAGVNGDTTSDGLRRLDPLLNDDVGVIVVALGANDGLRGVDLAVVEGNLSAIIRRAQARDIRVLLCGMETPPLHNWQYSLAFHELFPRLASTHGVPLVPFLLAGVALNPDLNGADWIHPNAAGARRIADSIWPFLEPLLRDE